MERYASALSHANGEITAHNRSAERFLPSRRADELAERRLDLGSRLRAGPLERWASALSHANSEITAHNRSAERLPPARWSGARPR